MAFGNVKNITDNSTGEVTLKCQHGPGGWHSLRFGAFARRCQVLRACAAALLNVPPGAGFPAAEECYFNKFILCAQALYPPQKQW